ncbi:MAG: putative DNA-binding mobile mystery protein A [Gammaproteobacteria bacterium]|jgi:predicted DNA-binding mobile mystery protein A
MEWKYRKTVLKQLDKKLEGTILIPRLTCPKNGWIKTVRTALGMTLKQLGNRANGISQSNLTRLEKQEVLGTTTIKTMENVARALNCKFVYAFVPETSFQDMLFKQAKEAAKNKVKYVSHSMSLEDQKLTKKEIEEQIAELADELLRTKPRLIWEPYKNS